MSTHLNQIKGVKCSSIASGIKSNNSLDLSVISKLKFISLGGGMFSRMDNYIQKQLPFEIPDFDEYANNSVKFLVDYFNSKLLFGYLPAN